MLRIFAVAAILAVAASSAQAEDSLNTRIHDAAVKACDAQIGVTKPISFYQQLSDECVRQVSADTLATLRARQVARTESSTASN